MRPVTWLSLGWFALLVATGVLAFGLVYGSNPCECALTSAPEPGDWREAPSEPDGAGFFVDGLANDAFHPMWVDTHLGIARLCPDESIPLGGWLARHDHRSRTLARRRAEDLSFRFVPAADVWVVSARDGSEPRSDAFVTAFRAERRPHYSRASLPSIVVLGGVGLAIACLVYSLGLAYARLVGARSMLKSTQPLGRDAYRSAESNATPAEYLAASRDAVRGLPKALIAAYVLVVLACVAALFAPA
jgi:hypothetical protein